MILISFILSLLLSFNSYAFATPAEYGVFSYDEVFDVEENEVSDFEYPEFIAIDYQSFIESVKNSLLDSEILDEEIQEDEVFLDDEIQDEELMILSADEDDISLLALSDEIKYKNVVVYHGRFNNTQCDLVIPYSSYSSLNVINGYLVNVGTSAVTGRLLYNGAVLNPSDYLVYSYTLNSLYGSSSNVYRYGSYNYQRRYYVNNNNIVTQDTYGNFTVEDIDVYYATSERLYYLGLILIFLLGGAFLCKLRF